MTDEKDTRKFEDRKLERLETRLISGAATLTELKQAVGEIIGHLRILVARNTVTEEDCAARESMRVVNFKAEINERLRQYSEVQPGWRGLLIQVKWPAAIVASVALFSPRLPEVLDFAGKFIKP